MEKLCKDCSVSKPISDFYRAERMADGHLNSCKACVRARVTAHRLENLSDIQAYDRDRGRTAHRKESMRQVRASRKADPSKAGRDAEVKSAWRRRNMIKRACHTIVAAALKSGQLTRQDCFGCGASKSDARIQAHHEDYTRPLDVRWYCPPCHGERHRQINAERRRLAS